MNRLQAPRAQDKENNKRTALTSLQVARKWFFIKDWSSGYNLVTAGRPSGQSFSEGKTTDQPLGVQSFVKRFLDTLETVGPALRPCGFSVSNFHNLFHSAVGRAPGTIIITRPRGAGRMEKVKEIGDSRSLHPSLATNSGFI